MALKTWGFTISTGIVFGEMNRHKSSQRLKMIQHAWIQENARQEVISAASGKTGRLGGFAKALGLIELVIY